MSRFMAVVLRAAAVSAALLLSTGLAIAKPAGSHTKQPSCCATKTRCCPSAQVAHCCDEPDKAACCTAKTACCDMKGCCGPKQPAGKAVHKAEACPVTGSRPAQCCASKAAPMPPCCMVACNTPGQTIR